MKQKSIKIRDDQEEFLQDNPSINVSGVLREKLDEMMEDRGYENEKSG